MARGADWFDLACYNSFMSLKECLAKRQEVIPAVLPVVIPIKEHVKARERLLNRQLTGAQARILFGEVIPKNADKMRDVIDKIAETGQIPNNKKIIDSSRDERDEFWKKPEFESISPEKRRVYWEDLMNNKYFKKIKEAIPDKNEPDPKEFFTRIDIDLQGENPAAQVYDTYMVEKKGDPSALAKQIVDNFSATEINNYMGTIKEFAAIFGDNSSEVTGLLTEGLKNIEKPDIRKEFITSAIENINLGDKMPGLEVVRKMEKNSLNWDEKQSIKQKTEQDPKNAAAAATAAAKDEKKDEKSLNGAIIYSN